MLSDYHIQPLVFTDFRHEEEGVEGRRLEWGDMIINRVAALGLESNGVTFFKKKLWL